MEKILDSAGQGERKSLSNDFSYQEQFISRIQRVSQERKDPVGLC